MVEKNVSEELDDTQGTETEVEVEESDDSKPSEDPTYEVKVGGKVFKVPLSELQSGYQRQNDYTQKTMKLSEERKTWEGKVSQYEQALNAVKDFLSDPKKVAEWLKKQHGYPLGEGAPADVEQLIEAKVKSVTDLTTKQLAQLKAELAQEQSVNSLKSEVDVIVKGQISQFPELSAIKGVERLIREEVAEMEPSDMDEAKLLFAQVTKRRADELRQFITEQRKGEAVKKSQARRGIEPPGGSGVLPEPEEELNLNDPKLRERILAKIIESADEE